MNRAGSRTAAALAATALLLAACGSDDRDDVSTVPAAQRAPDDPIPVEPDGGIGDTPDDPIPVEPDGGIGDTPGAIPFFGANDDRCASTTLTNSVPDDDRLRAGVDCFFAEYDAGRPVIWDVSIPTVEGDPILHRYAFDGTAVTIVVDARRDAFGIGEVSAETCTAAEPTELLPMGVDCEPIDHPGFPEAGPD